MSRSGRRNRFSSFGADPLFGLQFCRGANAAARSDPDVFADALVLVRAFGPLREWLPAFRASRFDLPRNYLLRPRSAAAARLAGARSRGLVAVTDGYGFAKQHGKPTFAGIENDSEISGVLNGLAVCAASRLHVVQCDT
jgi:hypothetical protein